MKSPAKINIFLKIVGKRGNYHELVSRFVKIDWIYDEIRFIPKRSDTFTIEGMDIPLEENIVFKAYQKIKNEKTQAFFKEHVVSIVKNIPSGAGLGGGSSNAATFLKMLNQACDLGYSQEILASIAAQVGADVPFFIYDYPAANVKGIGEVIEPFEDDVPPLDIVLLPLYCDTAKVYRTYAKHHFHPDISLAWKLQKLTSREILENIAPLQANDLYKPAIMVCPKLREYKENYFLSGSGSTVFKEKK